LLFVVFERDRLFVRVSSSEILAALLRGIL
jgi:hypothetical protein